MSDIPDKSPLDDVGGGEQSLVDPAGAADPAAARHGALPELVHAARRGARELGAPDRRVDRRRQADRRLHAARRDGRGAAPGGSLHRRHRHAHPQDVQAARRQPAADRAGARAGARRRDRHGRALPARARPPRGRDARPTTTASRSTRCSATSSRTSSRSCRSRRCCRTTCRRSRSTSPSPAGSPTSSRRA